MSYSDELECGTDNGGCEQNCVNTIGSYTCSCNTGYTLDSDGHNCDGENIYNINIKRIVSVVCLLCVWWCVCVHVFLCICSYLCVCVCSCLC